MDPLAPAEPEVSASCCGALRLPFAPPAAEAEAGAEEEEEEEEEEALAAEACLESEVAASKAEANEAMEANACGSAAFATVSLRFGFSSIALRSAKVRSRRRRRGRHKSIVGVPFDCELSVLISAPRATRHSIVHIPM